MSSNNTSDTLQQTTTGVSVSFIYGIVIGIAGIIVVITIVVAIIAFMRMLEVRLPWTTYELPRIRSSLGRQRSEVPVVEQEHVYSGLVIGQPPPVPARTYTPGEASVGGLTGGPTSEAGAGSNTRPPPLPPKPAVTKLRRLTRTFKLPRVNGPSKTK